MFSLGVRSHNNTAEMHSVMNDMKNIYTITFLKSEKLTYA